MIKLPEDFLFTITSPKPNSTVSPPFNVSGNTDTPVNASDITVQLLDANGNVVATATTVTVNQTAGTWEAHFESAPEVVGGTIQATCTLAKDKPQVTGINCVTEIIEIPNDLSGQVFESWDQVRVTLNDVALKGLLNGTATLAQKGTTIPFDVQQFRLDMSHPATVDGDSFSALPTGDGFAIHFTIQPSKVSDPPIQMATGFFTVKNS